MIINDNFYLLTLLAYAFCSDNYAILNSWFRDAWDIDLK
jgi:hypothetical protein